MKAWLKRSVGLVVVTGLAAIVTLFAWNVVSVSMSPRAVIIDARTGTPPAPVTWDTLYAQASFSGVDYTSWCSDYGVIGGSSAWSVVGDYLRMTYTQDVETDGGWCDVFFNGSAGRPNELTHGTVRFEVDVHLSPGFSGDSRMIGLIGTTPGNYFDAAARAGECVDDDLTARFFLLRLMFTETDPNNRLGFYDQFVSQTGTTLGDCFGVDGSGAGYGTATTNGGDFDPVADTTFTLAEELILSNFGREDGTHSAYVDGNSRRTFDNINYRNYGSEVVISGFAFKPVYGTTSPTPGGDLYMEFTNLRILWDSTAVPSTGRTPNTPTIDTVSVDSTSVALSSSAFSSPSADTHDSTIWEIDVAGGDFYPPVWADTTNSGLTTTAALGLTADTDYKAMVIHIGEDGGGSFRSDTISFTTDTIEAGGSPPPAPTVTGTNFAGTGDSLRLVSSAFGGSGTYDSIAFQVDTVGADFSTPQYWDMVYAAPRLTDTVPAIDSGAVVVVRALHVDAESGRGNWSVWDTVDMAVIPTSGPETVYFFSDWRNATGSSESAWGDGGKWTQWLSGTRTVTASPTCSGFSTTNVLSIVDGGANQTGTMFATPSVGDTIGLRFEFCVIDANGGSGGSDHHGVYYNGTGNNWGPGTLGVYKDGGGSTFAWTISGPPGGQTGGNDSRYFGPRSGNSMVNLSEGVVYRPEILWIRTGTNTYVLRGRLYNSAGTLLYDEWCDGVWGDCLTSFVSGTSILADAVFTTSGAGANDVRVLTFGNNDGPTAEYAAVAVCSSWCGPYPIAGVEN